MSGVWCLGGGGGMDGIAVVVVMRCLVSGLEKDEGWYSSGCGYEMSGVWCLVGCRMARF